MYWLIPFEDLTKQEKWFSFILSQVLLQGPLQNSWTPSLAVKVSLAHGLVPAFQAQVCLHRVVLHGSWTSPLAMKVAHGKGLSFGLHCQVKCATTSTHHDSWISPRTAVCSVKGHITTCQSRFVTWVYFTDDFKACEKVHSLWTFLEGAEFNFQDRFL